jgi:hypothetical protein
MMASTCGQKTSTAPWTIFSRSRTRSRQRWHRPWTVLAINYYDQTINSFKTREEGIALVNHAADLLGIKPSTLAYQIKMLGIVK